MLSDSPSYTGSGIISSGIEIEGSLKAVITFLKENFKIFAEVNRIDNNMNEKGLTQKLCILLNKKAKNYPFFFHSDFMENVSSGTSPQVDIGIISANDKIEISDREYNEDDSFFSIEAKRLPTPGSNREKEYVIGHNSPSGAMERFKKGIHGSRLKYAAIVGYIQDKDFEHWFLKINSWIEQLSLDGGQTLWSEADKLEKLANNNHESFTELMSENQRNIGTEQSDKIKIFHFWINLIT